MFEAIREDEQAKLVLKKDDGTYQTIAIIPRYFQFDLGIAQCLALEMNASNKILDLSI